MEEYEVLLDRAGGQVFGKFWQLRMVERQLNPYTPYGCRLGKGSAYGRETSYAKGRQRN
jgi:hypothetical protein